MRTNFNVKLNYQYRELLGLIRQTSEEFAKENHIQDKWSIHDHFAHLGRYQEYFLQRLKEILAKDNPSLPRYKAENDPEFEKWQKKGTRAIFDDYKVTRRELIQFLEDLSPDQLARVGTHPKFKAMNIEEWVHFFLLHEGHHIYAIFRMIRAF